MPDDERSNELDIDQIEDTEFDDESFVELDELLREATAATEEEMRLKRARKRLSHIAKSSHPEKDSEQAELLQMIRELEERRVWHTIARVALFRTQECATCGAKHSFFEGWFWEQAHASDPNARRLSRHAEVNERLPERREDHTQGAVELCSDCVECVLAINAATKGEPVE